MLLIALLLGCPQPEPACEPAADLTWANTGQPFLASWCTSCHSASVPFEERQGAPVGSDFDTWQGARAHADAIEAWATGVDAPMPPAGGPTDEERERFARWLACGDPIGTTPTPTSCGPTFEGDATDADDLCGQGYGSVAGDVTSNGAVPLACLCSIQGDLTVTGVTSGSVSLDALEQVGGAVEVVENPGLERFESALASAASVRIEANEALERVRLPRLAQAGSLLRVAHNPSLIEADTGGAVEQVDRIELVDDEALQVLGSFDALPHVPGEVVLEALPALPDCHGFFVLEEVGGLTIRGVGSAELHCFGSLRRVHGTLALQDNPRLQSVPGLIHLQQIDGDLRITGNPALEPDELAALRAQVHVQGTVDVDDNAPASNP